MQRFRSAIKIIGPVRLLVATLAGIAMTILTAWWFALEPKSIVPMPAAWRQEKRLGDFVYTVRRGKPANHVWTLDTAPGAVLIHAFTRNDAELAELLKNYQVGTFQAAAVPEWSVALEYLDNHPSVFEDVYGWPFPCLRSIQVMRHDRSGIPIGSIKLPVWLRLKLMVWKPIPIDPLVLPFAGNTLFYSAIWYALLVVPTAGVRAVRSHSRKRRGECPQCGYSLEGLTADTCPECGPPIKQPSSP